MITLVTDATTHHMTTEDDARRELRLTLGEDIAGLCDLIAKASAACALWCARPEGFGRATWRQTERIDCACGCIVLERDINPVIASITVDGTALTSADYEVDGSLLYRLSGTARLMWNYGVVVITYDAGYGPEMDSVPHDLERAVLITLAHLHAQRGRDPGVRTENDGLTMTAYMDPSAGIPAAATGLLQSYRRYAF